MIERISVIVLAAGLSRRMGKANKLLLPLGEKTIVETTISNIIAAELGETLVIVGHEAEAVRCQMSDFRFQVLDFNLENANFEGQILTNPRYEMGMTTSIQTGVAAANREQADWFLVLAHLAKKDKGSGFETALFKILSHPNHSFYNQAVQLKTKI